MNTILEMFKLLLKVFYCMYKSIIYVGINIIYFKDNDCNCKYTEFINISNNYVNNLTGNILWKYCELLSCINTYYVEKITPTINKLTNDYFIYPIILIDNNIEILYLKENNSEVIGNYKYDLIFYIDYSINKYNNQYTIISDSYIENFNINNYIKSSVNILYFTLTFKNTTYDINLKSPMNFLLVNNKLNVIFLDGIFINFMEYIYQKNIVLNIC